jgi:hypothetical protein
MGFEPVPLFSFGRLGTTSGPSMSLIMDDLTVRRSAMKSALIALVFAASTFVGAQTPVLLAACGPENASFEVKLDKSQHTVAQPEPGKATAYFIQDNGAQSFGIGVSVVARIGLDGAWVGADKNNSFFSAPVEPGEHHMCVSLQSGVIGNPLELAHFTAEAGKVYYFRVRYVSGGYLILGAVDDDEAKYQIASFPMSISHIKK